MQRPRQTKNLRYKFLSNGKLFANIEPFLNAIFIFKNELVVVQGDIFSL